MPPSPPHASEMMLFDQGLLDDRSWWSEQLKELPEAVTLPLTRPRPPGRAAPAASLDHPLSAALRDAIASLTRDRPLLEYTLLLTAVAVVLSRNADQPRVVVGSPARRGKDGAPPVNALAVILDVDDALSFRELLAAARDRLAEVYAHQRYPGERLIKHLPAERGPDRFALFDVSIAHDELHGPLPAIAHDVELTVLRAPGGLALRARYREDLFDAAAVRRFLGELEVVLGQALADTARPVAALGLMTAADEQRLARAWNATARPHAAVARLHELIEARAAAQPDAPAVVSEGRTLTYAELDAEANRLARLLGDRGVRRGEPVAVAMEPTADMIVAVLAVLKAGGFYVPIEATWPAERWGWILAHQACRVLLVRSPQLPRVYELLPTLPELRDVVCLDVAEEQLPVEPVDREGLQAVWDFVADTAGSAVEAAGFINSYTGQPFSLAEVHRYRDHVCQLARPHLPPGARVLELGCGSGLIMFELAREVAAYVGVDPSPRVQARNRARAAELGCSSVELVTGWADRLPPAAEPYDLVVLASTAQFFPGPVYLRHVLDQALAQLKPGGAVLIADVMDAARKQELRRSLEAFASEHDGQPGVETKTTLGDELYLDEQFFADLAAAHPAVADCTVVRRGDSFRNELDFRFDVVLRKRAEPAAHAGEPRRRVWTRWHARRHPAAPPEVAGAPADLAYVIHTSGSTGAPKGVALQHAPVVNVIDWVNRGFEVGPGDRLLFVTSLCFDLSVYDIFGVLAAGATIRVASAAERSDPAALLDILRREPITFWDSAPAALAQLAPLLPAGGAASPALRLVFLSGDWVPLGLPDRVRRSFPNAKVVALGGATEAAIWSNYHVVDRVDPGWASIPYGRPIQNARYYILDSGLRMAPAGVAGDLYIGGECLMAFYAGDPRATAAKLLPDPFTDRPGARMYATGDRARRWEDGTIEFLGRRDHQVKIRGFRIELGEIEAALRDHPAVGAAVACVRGEGAGRRLAAYVVPRADHEPKPALLRGYLAARLPEYMVPAELAVLGALPLTPNGKVDRRALAALEDARPDLDAGFVAPATDLERQLAAIWCEILGVERVGVRDSFFDLGGNSLQATQVLARIGDAFRVSLSLRRFFAVPRVQDLAAAVVEAMREREQPARPQPELVEIRAVARAGAPKKVER